MAIQRITSGIIADGAIVATDIGDGIVTNAKLAGSITFDKITSVSNTAISGLIQAAQIGSANASVIDAGTLAKARLPTGSVLQAVFASTLTQVEGSFSTATSLGLAASITPTSASNKILVLVSANGLGVRGSGSTFWDGYLSRGGTNLGAFGNYIAVDLVGGWWGASLCILDSPNTTSSTTYSLNGIRQGGSDNCVFNISTGAAGTGNRSTMTLLEIVA